MPDKTTHLTFSWGSLSPCTGHFRDRVRKSEWHQDGFPMTTQRKNNNIYYGRYNK